MANAPEGIETFPVELYMYDLSDGWCRNLGPLCPVKAVWHTSIVVYGREYVFGSFGIKFHEPLKPKKKLELGYTKVPPLEFKMYVKGLKYSTWMASTYDPFKHNCNSFTDHLAQFLGVGPIPEYIFDSIEKLIESPFYSKVVDMITKNGNARPKTEPNSV